MYEVIARLSAALTAPYLGNRYQPITQAGSSPKVAYINPNADPFDGYLDINSAYIKAVLKHISPPRAKEINKLVPAY
jgi:hypothetical protein